MFLEDLLAFYGYEFVIFAVVNFSVNSFLSEFVDEFLDMILDKVSISV